MEVAAGGRQGQSAGFAGAQRELREGTRRLLRELTQRLKILGGADGWIIVGGTPLNAGYSGDGYAATAARFTNPLGSAFDKNGDYIIADSGNSVVRVINALGVVQTPLSLQRIMAVGVGAVLGSNVSAIWIG